jgi:hypothetical protein
MNSISVAAVVVGWTQLFEAFKYLSDHRISVIDSRKKNTMKPQLSVQSAENTSMEL